MVAIKKENLRFFLLPLILLILIISTFFLLLQPIRKQLEESRKMLLKEKAELSEMKKEISGYQQVKEELARLKVRANFYENYLPAEERLPSFFSKLTKIADETGVKYSSLKPLKEKEKVISPTLYEERKFELRLIAGFHQLGHFINSLERMNRFVEVKELRINRGKDIFNENVRLLIFLYLLKGPLK